MIPAASILLKISFTIIAANYSFGRITGWLALLLTKQARVFPHNRAKAPVNGPGGPSW